MAVDCNCPECGEFLGKDVEVPRSAWCGQCMTAFQNPRGYRTDIEGRPLDDGEYDES